MTIIKLEIVAMQQALEALIVAEEFVNIHSEDWYISGQQDLKQIREAITALREALAGVNMSPTEQADEEAKTTDYMLGFSDGKNYAHKYEQAEQDSWPSKPACEDDKKVYDTIANNYLSQTEQAEQKQMAVLDITYGREPECYATPNAEDLPEGTYRLYAAPVQQAEQGPVAWMQTVRALTDQCAALIQERDELQKQVWRYEKHGVTCQTYRHKVESSCAECNVNEIYAHPVRTKDLTVSELDAIIEKHYDDEMDLKAMILDGIAADREKNK